VKQELWLRKARQYALMAIAFCLGNFLVTSWSVLSGSIAQITFLISASLPWRIYFCSQEEYNRWTYAFRSCGNFCLERKEWSLSHNALLTWALSALSLNCCQNRKCWWVVQLCHMDYSL